MNSSLPSSICGSASDSSYTNTDQSSIRSAGHTSIASTSTSSKPKRTVRFQDPDPISTDADSVSVTFHPGPNLSLSSLDLSDDNSSSYTRHSRQSSSAASSIKAGKQPMRNASPSSSRFGRHLTVGRPPLIRDHSVSSTASAPGELEFTDWLARMEEMKARPGSALSDKRASPRPSKGGSGDAEKEERKKKRRSWVNLLVR